MHMETRNRIGASGSRDVTFSLTALHRSASISDLIPKNPKYQSLALKQSEEPINIRQLLNAVIHLSVQTEPALELAVFREFFRV